MKKTRLYTSYVFKRDTQDGKQILVKMCEAESGSEAIKQAKAMAESTPGIAFCAGNMWPFVMTKEVKSVVYVDPEDPSKTLKESDVTVDDDVVEEDDDSKGDVLAPAVVREPIVLQPPPTPKVDPVVKPAATVVESKPVKKPAEKPAEKTVVKEEPVKQVGFTDLFADTGKVAAEDKQEETFANEDVIDPDAEGDAGDGGIPKGLF